MRIEEFDYGLPRGRIAQRPAEPRDSSRMLLVDRAEGTWEDAEFRDLPRLLRGDEVLVVNNTRVIPARLFGRRVGVKSEAAGKRGRAHLSAVIEVLLLRQMDHETWAALVRPGRKVRVGEKLVFGNGDVEAEVIGRGELGLRNLRFRTKGGLLTALERIGHVPLPPYIDRKDDAQDRENYQTVFAQHPGAVAAPTAGLHFTPGVLKELRDGGIEVCEITLHVGLGTFQPIHVSDLENHRMHGEAYEIPEVTAERVNKAKQEGRPVLAVGTTVVRALEDASSCSPGLPEKGAIRGCMGEATLFIRPGHKFRVVDQLLTNFHLPRSSLLVLVSAFAGREMILRAYEHAVRGGYRFYSYGDCMLIR